MTTRTRMTSAEFLALPETTQRMELIDGEIIVAPAPELFHQDVAFLAAVLVRNVGSNGKMYMSPVDVHFADGEITQPDVLWLAPDSACQPVDGKFLQGAPDLIIEVLSPGTAHLDRGRKFQLYEQHGAREYWLIDPAGRYVEVYRHNGEKFDRLGAFAAGESFTSTVLNGASIQPAAFFGGAA